MLSPVCQAVLSSVREAIQAGNVAAPASSVAEHSAGCAYCRGALMLLAAVAFEPPQPSEEIDCVMCREYLAPFIDQEIVDARTAVHSYPQVWWHIWSCGECAEIYEYTRRLVAAERVGLVMPISVPHPAVSGPPAASPPLPELPIFQLKRAFLFLAFSGQPSRTRSGIEADEHEIVLFDGESFDHNVQLRVTQVPEQPWRMTIAITPPIAGWLTLTLDELERRIRFDSHGLAVLSDIPAAALCSSDGPDLIGSVEPDNQPGVTLE